MIDPGSRRSVNWTVGMLLSPEQFQDQDRYVRESVSWLVRHCIPGAGLVGGGVHLAPAEYGMMRHDPKFEVVDDGETVHLDVREARGVTRSGTLIDVGGGSPLSEKFSKEALDGSASVVVYVVATGGTVEDPTSVGQDPANRNQAAYVQPELRISLGVSPEHAPQALAIGRLRRASATLGFEMDGSFIPACMTLLAHSQLYEGYRRIRSEVLSLAGRFTALHRVVAAWITGARQRSVDVRPDVDRLLFVGRAVAAVDDCAYALLDPTESPDTIFQQVDRMARRLALALDLSDSTQSFIRQLSQSDHSYETILEEESDLLAVDRQTRIGLDLAEPLSRAQAVVERAVRLTNALEAKYVDYRINERIDALRFLVDRDGEEFFEAVQAQPRMRTQADILTLTYSQISLNAKMGYRLVLVGEAGSAAGLNVGDVVDVTLHFNTERGGSPPITQQRVCEISQQLNFGIDFDPPSEVGAITDLRVVVRGTRFRTAVIYRRVRGVVSDPLPPTVIEEVPPPSPPPAEPGGGIVINPRW